MQSNDRVLWLRSFLQPVTYLSLAFGAFIIAGLIYLAHKDERDAYNSAARSGRNLALAFEGYMSRSIKSADNTLRVLRMSYQRDPEHFNITEWGRNPDVQNELTLQLTITGADGKIKASTSERERYLIGNDIGTREHFVAQIDPASDEVFISKPFTLKISGKQAIMLSRRITNPDGSFGGIVSAALDPMQLQKFYDVLDLGTESSASLVGFDGVIRARGGGNATYREKIGRKLANVGVMQRYKQAPHGTYWNVGGTVDAVRRLVTYRVVEGYPLIALVGLAKSDIYRHSAQNARIYYGIGAALLVVIATTICFGAAREYKLKLTALSLKRTNDLFESALVSLPVGLSIYDDKQKISICNSHYSKMYGLTEDQTRPGTPILDIFNARIAAGSAPKDTAEYLERGLRNAKQQRARHFNEPLADGRIIDIHLGLIPGGGWIAVHQDITSQKQAEAEITHLAHYDTLTGLANRALFLRHINTATESCRADGRAFAVHILDLDRFKEVNDTLGHAYGDQLLQIVAQRLLTVVSKHDIVARLGGDEFAILQPLEGNETSHAGKLAYRLLDVFAEPFALGEHRSTVETTIGIALAPDHGDEAEQLIKNADLALYRAKSEGRNTYRMFRPEMEMEARTRHVLQADLRNAIACNEFELHYQPVITAGSREICGVESLVRWRHPTRGMVSPDKFIPLAEETGLIVPLGEWVLRKACYDAATWPEHLKVAVNLSSVQFRRSDLAGVVSNALAESGLSPHRLELEVTESVLLENNEENTGVLHRLRERGISIALDDFGTGYSSLSYLLSFPFDKIKIDRSFVANLCTRPDCAAIVGAITGIARNMNITTTAEGVETEDQMTMLRAAGCGQMQGYLFGRPQPKAEIDQQIMTPSRQSMSA